MDDSQSTPANDTDSLDWTRVHPLTPFLDVGFGLVAMIFAFVTFILNDIQEAAEVAKTAVEHGVGTYILEHMWWTLIAVAVLVIITVGSWWSWRVRAYAIDHDAVYSRWGILNKQLRKARLDRVQSIDINQKLSARLFGMAELKFDVAGGAGSEVVIKYLTKKQAEELREDMLQRVRTAKRGESGSQQEPTSAGPSSSPNAEVTDSDLAEVTSAGSNEQGQTQATAEDVAKAHRPGAPVGSRISTALSAGVTAVSEDIADTVNSALLPYRIKSNVGDDGRLLMVPAHRVLLSRLASSGTIVLIVLLLITVVGIVATAVMGDVSFSVSGGLAALVGMAGALFSMASSAFKDSNFSVAITADGLVITSGLLETQRRVIPLDRIQAVELRQGLLWRAFGWWRVNFNMAGTSDAGTSSLLLPVGTMDEVMALLGLVLPDPGLRPDQEIHGGDLIREAALTKRDGQPLGPAASLYTHQPSSSKWLDPLSWKTNKFAFTDTMLVVRRGVMTRVVQMVPHARVQSMALREGPLQSAFGLATLSVHSTTGPVFPRIKHMSRAHGPDLLNDYAAMTVHARKVLDGVAA